jgi:hypothetical protein
MREKHYLKDSQHHSKTVLPDASSAILLYKAGIVETFFDCFSVVLSPIVFQELTCNGHDGADKFAAYYREHRFYVAGTPADSAAMLTLEGGERQLVLLYKGGCGDYVVLDDKKAAAYCRDNGIPYVNALLVPKILLSGGYITDACCSDATRLLTGQGRYAPWVIRFSENCTGEDLKKYI